MAYNRRDFIKSIVAVGGLSMINFPVLAENLDQKKTTVTTHKTKQKLS